MGSDVSMVATNGASLGASLKKLRRTSSAAPSNSPCSELSSPVKSSMAKPAVALAVGIRSAVTLAVVVTAAGVVSTGLEADCWVSAVCVTADVSVAGSGVAAPETVLLD